MSHTPGPWIADMGYIVTEARIVPARSDNELHQVYIAEITAEDDEGLYVLDQTVQKANAKLIAAAPELLEALRACIRAIDEEVAAGAGEDHPIINEHAKIAKKARAALAKAQP